MNMTSKPADEAAGPRVYAAINAVQAALAKDGISKSRHNKQQNYAFRGIEDVFAALSPLLAENGLCIMPRVVSHKIAERVTQKGLPLFTAYVEVEFDIVAAADGRSHTVRTVGEAMDTADKATNKAMSAAYKYMAFLTFAIPVSGMADADETTHDVGEPAPRPPLISDAQRGELMQLLDHLNVPVAEFLKAARLASLADVTQDRFEGAKRWINDRAREQREADRQVVAEVMGEALDDLLDDEIPDFGAGR